MGIKLGYIKTKREVFFRGTNGEKYILNLLKGKDMYSFIKRKAKDYRVDCQAPIMFSSDVLLSDSCKEEFFFIHPEKSKVIERCKGYDDTWYLLNVSRIKKRTMPYVDDCLKILYKNGFNEDSLVSFIKLDDGYYHLVADGEEFGYLDDSNSDAEFKNMLAYVFKDVGHTVDVVVLPSKGESLLFASTLGVYNKKEDFDKALKSKGLSNKSFVECKEAVLV